MAEDAGSPITAEEYERRDERSLRRALGSSTAAVLSDRALSVGVGVPVDTDWVERTRRRGIPIVRRSTGGTGVLHEAGDLVWSIVLPRGDARVGRDYSHAYSRFGAGATGFLAGLGLDAGWTAPPAVSDSCCTLGARGCVLSVGDRVVGGAAQHLTRTALLHHGTISVTVDRDLLRELFDLVAPADADRLAGIREFEIDLSGPELAARLAAALQAAFG
jgi:lipoate-protein ligase A